MGEEADSLGRLCCLPLLTSLRKLKYQGFISSHEKWQPSLTLMRFPSSPRLVFGLTAASLAYVLFVLPVAIASYPSAYQAIGKEWYGTAPAPLSRLHTGSSKRMGAKFGEGNFVRADWLCIGCPVFVGSRKEENLNRGHFSCNNLYVHIIFY